MTIADVSDSIRRFVRDDGGATAIEYALIAGGISVALLTIVYVLGDSVAATFDGLATSF